MKQIWNKFADKVDGWSLQWRVVLFAVLSGAGVWGVLVLGANPLLEQQRSLNKQRETLTASITAANTQDTDRQALELKLHDLKQQLAQRDQNRAARLEPQVSPQQTLQLLDQLLSQSHGLSLVKLEKAPVPAPAVAATAPVAVSAVAAIITPPKFSKHEVTITLRGSYFDLLDYLERAEQLPYKINWVKLDYQVENYPTATLKLTLYTQGGEQWLGV